MSYVGGEVINGTVIMSCVQPFFAKGVFVKLEGYESCKFQEVHTRREGDHTHRDVHVRQDRNEFFCVNLNVYAQQGLVQPGQYQFPFTYKLPDVLPGTYWEEGGDWSHHLATGYAAEIIYFAEVRVESDRGVAAREEVRFVVNEKSDRALAPSYASNSKTFAFTKGKLKVDVWLDHNSYFPGNTVLAKMQCNNTSTKATDKIFLKIFRVLDLQAGHHRKHLSTQVYTHVYDGLPPSFFGVRFLGFQIPLNFQPTTSIARTVKARYEFVLEHSIPGAINLRTSLDIAVRAPQFLFAGAPPPLPPVATIPHEANFRPPWQEDSTAPTCLKCGASFGLFTRRHHCRSCGKVHCDNCTKTTMLLPNLGYDEEPVRVCDPCVEIGKQGGKRFEDAPADFGSAPIQEPEWHRPPVSTADVQGATAPPAQGAPVEYPEPVK